MGLSRYRVRLIMTRMITFAVIGCLVFVTCSTRKDDLVSSGGPKSRHYIEFERGSDRLIAPPDSNELASSDDIDSSCSSDDDETAEESRGRNNFLSRMSLISTELISGEDDAKLEAEIGDTETEGDRDVTLQSDLTRPGRHIHIVTTASLPWMTGTAVNPLLRAAYLHERTLSINSDTPANRTTHPAPKSWVTLVIPWLELPEDQEKVYGQVFKNTTEQELVVRAWLTNAARMPGAAKNLNIVFYNARYHAGLGSVFAMGDIIQQLPQNELDVCILEEPEHVNWYRAPGHGWTKRYNYVVGIIHTNYNQYATQHYSGLWTAPAIRIMSAAMIRAYCHKVIKLSAVLQEFAPEKEVTMNVHGVRHEFLLRDEAASLESVGEQFDSAGEDTTEVYFIGKLLWTKGLDILLELEEDYRKNTGDYFRIDIFGSGPDKESITRAFHRRRRARKTRKMRKAQRASSKRSRTKQRRQIWKGGDSFDNLFTKAFTWANRRRTKRSKSSSPIAALRNLYEEASAMLDFTTDEPVKKASTAPAILNDTVAQISDHHVIDTKDEMKSRREKAPAKLERLALDLSQFKMRIEGTLMPSFSWEFGRKPIPSNFPGRVDHAELKHSHNIFVNPSVSEVLCTTTFEALAMGKFAIVPVHPSNTFFLKFPNCLGYRDPYEFVANLRWALTHEPIPLSEEVAREFTWEAATDRLIEAASITHQEAIDRELLGKSKIDDRIAWVHNQLGKGVKGDVIRKVLGAGPASNQVKYEKQQKRDGQDSEDEEVRLYQKFRDSTFVQAIRKATANSITAT